MNCADNNYYKTSFFLSNEGQIYGLFLLRRLEAILSPYRTPSILVIL